MNRARVIRTQCWGRAYDAVYGTEPPKSKGMVLLQNPIKLKIVRLLGFCQGLGCGKGTRSPSKKGFRVYRVYRV